VFDELVAGSTSKGRRGVVAPLGKPDERSCAGRWGLAWMDLAVERERGSSCCVNKKTIVVLKGALNAAGSEDGVCVSALDRAVVACGCGAHLRFFTRHQFHFHAASSSSTSVHASHGVRLIDDPT
jgi:hypothetical protein